MRTNDHIRASEIRLIGPDGEQIGIVALQDALNVAQEANLDLVEVAPAAHPPVCKIMDYGKAKYEASQRARDSRRKQTHTVVKEMKFKLRIGPHDYETKRNRIAQFLEKGDKVKVTITFRRGRESARSHLGARILDQLSKEVADLAVVESPPTRDGSNMTMFLAPHRKKI